MGNFIFLYQSPNQSQDVFHHFIVDNFEIKLDSVAANNPFLLVVLFNLNAQTKTWYDQGKAI